jgi:hypothetical protein
MRTLTKRLIAAGAAAGIAVGVAGVAYAEGWFAYGTATFMTSSGTMQPLEVSTNLTGSDPLLPGTSSPVEVMLDNVHNNVAVTVTALSMTGLELDDPHYAAGCRSWFYTFTAPPQLPVLAKGGTGTDVQPWRSTVTGTLNMLSSAPVACQGAGVTVHLRAVAQAGDTSATSTATETPTTPAP